MTENLLKNNAVLLGDEYHLCCYDPAMWLEKGIVFSIVKLINGHESLLKFWHQKPIGNGPWSWPLKLLTPKQVGLLKKRFWKIKTVFTYQIFEGFNIEDFLNDNKLEVNYVEKNRMLFLYLPHGKENKVSYYIDDLKSISEFYEVIEEYFGRYVLFDVEKNKVFLESSEGPYGSYTLSYDHLGRKGCRNYLCVYKCPVFPLDEHFKKLTYKIELVVEGLTSEVTGIIIYAIDGGILAKLNEEGEFE